MPEYTPCPNCKGQPALTILTAASDCIIFCTCGVAGPRGTREQAIAGWARLAGYKIALSNACYLIARLKMELGAENMLDAEGVLSLESQIRAALGESEAPQ